MSALIYVIYDKCLCVRERGLGVKSQFRDVATDSGPEGPGSNWDLFYIVSTKAV